MSYTYIFSFSDTTSLSTKITNATTRINNDPILASYILISITTDINNNVTYTFTNDLDNYSFNILTDITNIIFSNYVNDQTIIKNRVTNATTNPISTNDILANFNNGCIWINTTTNIQYTCNNNTQDNAVWQTLTQGRTQVNSSTYTLQALDYFIGVLYSTTGTCTITLPAISSMITNRTLYIVDEGGNAQNNNITIVSNVADTIVGSSSLIMNRNYMAIGLYCNKANTWYLF